MKKEIKTALQVSAQRAAVGEKALYQPKTGQACLCLRGIERDNCPRCEGTGQMIDFKVIRSRRGR